MTDTTLSSVFLRDLYTRMLLTRIVDDYTWKLHRQGFITFLASCRGHEAAQVGSAICIEVGTDFTLPYYRDLGVVLTVGMTVHDVFRTYLQNRSALSSPTPFTPVPVASASSQPLLLPGPYKRSPADPPGQTTLFHHWGYHKHNMVTGPAPVATQLLHAAGIAFASKLRKASVVTIAYCGAGATTEPDFLEGLRFAAQHQLPVIFICEQAGSTRLTGTTLPPSCLHSLPLPAGLQHQQVDGTNVVTVYQAMQSAMHHARSGLGPLLLEIHLARPLPGVHIPAHNEIDARRSYSTQDALTLFGSNDLSDPLVRCQRLLQEYSDWDDAWAYQLYMRLSAEVDRAWHDVLHDTLQIL